MTFRGNPASRPVARRTRTLESTSRRNLVTNLFFGLVVVVAILILAGAAAASWYGDHFGEVANVNGTTITRDQYRDRYRIEQFRFDAREGRIRDDFSAGRLTANQRDQRLSVLEQERNDLSTVALDNLVDATLQAKLAADQGITISDADVDAALTKEATRPEERHVWLISVAPAVDPGATKPTDAARTAAREKIDKALADVKSGKKWEDVAKAVSGDSSASSGGDIGWFTADDGQLETAFEQAVFAAQKDAPTDVVEGIDGVYRIGRVTDILPAQVDDAYRQSFQNRGISLDTYETAVRADATKDALRNRLLAQVVDNPSPQRQVQEIHISIGQGAGDEVKVRHILYAPNDLTDAQAIGALKEDDPAWTKARQEAQAAYDTLVGYVGRGEELEKKFEQLANAETDDPSGKGSGGELPYFTAEALDRPFADAIFKNGLKKGDLIGPIKSSFGYHVILFEDRRPPAESRAQNVALEASRANADFAALVRQYSDGPKSDTDGSLGWVARYQLPKQLEDAVFATQVPGTSDLIDVPDDGWYLFKVSAEETRLPDPIQAANLRRTVFDTWYAEQKKNATIKDDLGLTAPTS
jgi:parvulin-like peptidyl-prolyl isomerase